MAMMAAERPAACETKRKKAGNTNVSAKKRNPKSPLISGLCGFLFILLTHAPWSISEGAPEFNLAESHLQIYGPTSPVGLSVCGERCGCGGRHCCLSDCLDQFLKQSTQSTARQIKCFPYRVVFVVM